MSYHYFLRLLQKYQKFFVFIFLFLISALSIEYFYALNQLTIYADTSSRLDIARNVIDNITPGFAQLGNVWLPLPQILMLPFIWNNFFWHSGLAGSFMSMVMFIIGGYYVFKSSLLLTNQKLAAIFSLLIYSLNINLMYLQSTAMSETTFICTLSVSLYYFLIWMKTNNKMYLIPSGIAVSAMTLTRYEGLSILLASIPMVFVISYLLNKDKNKAEGQTILYSVLAITGFTLWSLYLLVIFGDPLYWIHYYATPQQIGNSTIKAYTQQKSFISAFIEYFTAMIWTIGLIPMLLGIIGSVIIFIKAFQKKSLIFIPLFLPLSLYLFMILTLQRNTPIMQPDINFKNLLSGTTSTLPGFNIRYGILLLPWISILSSIVLVYKNLSLRIIIFLVFSIQIVSYIFPKYTVIYQIPLQIHGGRTIPSFALWLQTHYDGGKILISALDHEDQMFEMGFNYSTYIHEGNRQYWKDSLKHPAKYATWIVLDYTNTKDPVVNSLLHSQDLNKDYKIVYQETGLRIYKIIHKPYIGINT